MAEGPEEGRTAGWRALGRARRSDPSGRPEPGVPQVEIEPGALVRMFASPPWLRDLGRLAWFLVGVALLLVGAVWLLGQVSTIVEPMLAALVIAAVASPGVAALERRGLPRAAGATLVLLGVMVAGLVIVFLVLAGVVAEGDRIAAAVSDGLAELGDLLEDAGAGGVGSAESDLRAAVPEVGETLLRGVTGAIEGLTSLVFYLSFLAFGIFFLLKDGPAFRRAVDRHMGVPQPVATLATGEVLGALRRYFAGVTIVAVFNGIVIGIGAWLLGVPLAGTIAVVTFATAYVPFVGAFVAGAFAVVIALSDGGTGTAVAMLVVVLLAQGVLQQVVQPIAFGATLGLNPLVVLVVTIAGGALFGMTGLILAAPLVAAGVRIAQGLARARAAAEAPEPERGVHETG